MANFLPGTYSPESNRSMYAYHGTPALKPKVKPAPKPVGSGVMMPQFQTPPGVNSLSGALQGIQKVTRPALGAPPMGAPPPQYPTTTPDQAVAMGRQDVSTLEGAMANKNWNSAGQMLLQRDIQGARDYNAQRAEQTGGLRQQMFGRLGNRGSSPEARGIGWQGPTVAEPQHVPGQLVARTPQQEAGDAELMERQTYRDQMRENMRQQIKAAGGFKAPRTSGIGGLIDRVLPPKQLNADDFQRPFFAQQVLDQEAQKAKRQRYLAGEGEYAGKGPQERQAAIAQERMPITLNAMMKSGARQGRIQDRLSGGPQQRMLNNYMAMRNPGIAMESMRMNTAMQIANANRELDREELGLKRDALKYGMDESKQNRLDAIQARRDEMQQRQTEFSGQQGLAQQGLGLQREGLSSADKRGQQMFDLQKQQGDLQLEEMRAKNRPTAMERLGAIEQMASQGVPRDVAERRVDNALGSATPVASSGTPGRPIGQPVMSTTSDKKLYRPGSRIPDDLAQAAEAARSANDPQLLVAEAQRLGYHPGAVDSMWKTIMGNKKVSVAKPQGTRLWDVISNFLGPGEESYNRGKRAWSDYLESP